MKGKLKPVMFEKKASWTVSDLSRCLPLLESVVAGSADPHLLVDLQLGNLSLDKTKGQQIVDQSYKETIYRGSQNIFCTLLCAIISVKTHCLQRMNPRRRHLVS